MSQTSRSIDPTSSPRAVLDDVELRRYLQRYLRRRLPAAEAEDALQSVLCAALEAPRLPVQDEELRRFLTVVARRKVANYYRASAREHLEGELEIEAHAAPIDEASLLRWAERQAATSSFAHADETLEWMAREGDGEKLEHIAEEAHVPATAVRQRVSRLRRFMKERWALELAVASVLCAIVAWWLFSRHVEPAERRFALPPVPSVIMPNAFPDAPKSLPAIDAPKPQPSVMPSSAPTIAPTIAPSTAHTIAPRPTTAGTTMTTPMAPRPTLGTGTGTGTGATQ